MYARIVAMLVLFLFSACGGAGSGDGPSGPEDAYTWAGDGQRSGGDAGAIDGRLPDPDGDNPGDGDGGGNTDTIDPFLHGIVIVQPEEGQTVTGPLRIRLEPVQVAEWVDVEIKLTANGAWTFSDRKLPTELILDTRQFPAGELVLEATAAAGSQSCSDSRKVQVDNPLFNADWVSASRFVVKNGETLEIDVAALAEDLEIAADFSALDSSWQAGAETLTPLGNGLYRISWAIGANNSRGDGLWPVAISLTDGVHSQTFQELFVRLQNQPEIPLRVDRGIFVDGPPPEASQGWMQPISLVYGNDFIITGGSGDLAVDFSGYMYPEEIVGLIISVEGYSGHYQVPLEDSPGEEELLLLLRPYLDTETPPETLNVQIAARDISGQISPPKAKSYQVQSVGTGDIQVSIAWDTKTDVDLHVVEPGGCEIYYGNDTCNSGGWLDLDSNAGCAIDGVNAENIFWPEGQAPIGDYTVRVDFWEDCFWSGADYTVTIHWCGDVDVIDGHFDPGDDDMGGAGDGVTVFTFNNENCGRILRGTVRYEDRTFNRWGFTARSWRPVRYATVELYREADDKLLGTAFTDRWGRYALTFANNQEPGAYLKIRARTDHDSGLRKITVLNHPKFMQVYTVKSDTFDEQATEYPVYDVDINEGLQAGAFNIFDVLVSGYDLTRMRTGRDLGVLDAFWATGADTTDTLYCSQYLYDNGVCSELGALSIQGKETDRDEYDDMVIQKEFFKLVLDRVARDSHPGGEHFGTRDEPTRAWTEGVSRFFACVTSDSPHYVNSRPLGVTVVEDLEDPNTPFAQKTSPPLLTGNLSALLPASLLWDLHDAALEDHDTVQGGSQGIFDALFNYLPNDLAWKDRGVPGVDLVDFLDGWFCRGWKQQPELEKILQHTQFPYDFGGPDYCVH